MFRQQAHELKQQGAIEAARDPNSTVTSDDAERELVADTKKAGGAAYHFDANASPEAKAAQARSHVPDDFHHQRKGLATNVITDLDDGTPTQYDLPPPSKAGARPASSSSRDSMQTADERRTGDPRWALDRTGWGPRFGGGHPDNDGGPTLLDHQTWVEGKLDDKWFGEWYYNAGVIMFACLATYTVTLLGGGLAWVFLIMATCGTYYRTSIRRVRRNFRDDLQREVAMVKLENDTESLEWMNTFLVKFWPIFAPVLCDTIINSVDQVLSTSTPAFLDSLRLKTFILGTKPPRLEHVKTYPKSDDDIVLMDWKFSFNPNDVADLTTRQIKNKINPRIALEIRVGKGVVSKGFDVLVEDMAFSGLMRVKIKLQIPFPHVEKAEISFLERPEIDYVCKPLGGDTFGFDINFIPGLESFIQEQIHANIGPIMYDPHAFPIEIAKMLSGNAVDQAIGVLQISLHGAQGLRNPDKFPGVPDPYIQISINNREVLAESKKITQSSSPRWNQTFNLIVTSLKDSLTMQAFDFNEYRKDKELGIATFALSQLEHENVHDNLHLEVMGNGRARGVIEADIRFFPVMIGDKQPDGTIGEAPESNTGIAKFTVEQAKELDGSKSLVGKLNPYAILLLNGKEVQVSQKLKRTNNPIWPNASKEFLITDRPSTKLGLVIKDERDLGGDPILGTYQIKLDDMLELMAKGQEWYNLAGAQSGRAKMMLQWKPVQLSGSGLGSGGYVTPIGILRIHFHNARDLRNLETFRKSDPYVRVLLSGVEKGRTVTFQNNLNPEFEEIIYVPVHSLREKLALEVMDSEALGKDRSLGQVDLITSDYIRKDDNSDYLAHVHKQIRSGPLLMNGKGIAKGVLNYTCTFYPALNVAEPDAEQSQQSVSTNGISIQPSKIQTGIFQESNGTRNTSVISQAASSTGSVMLHELNREEEKQDETGGVKQSTASTITLGVKDLQKYESGLIIFKLVDAQFAHHGCQVDFVMDDMANPAFTSSKAKSREITFNETGDAIVRELDFSKITIRIRDEKQEGKDNPCYAKMTGQTLDVLSRHLYQTHPITIKGKDGLDNKISIQLRYLPIKMDLDPSESINNMGRLRCEVLDADDLPAADRNGFSDPYCKFELNGKQVFKTQVQKKTLHPAWNEFFEVDIPSRTGAQLKVECWDWDRAAEDDHLGSSAIDLKTLQPLQQQEFTLNLNGKSGVLRLRMLFKPNYVTRSSQGSSTFSGTFATPGKIIGAPVKGVGKGAAFVGGNVARGASFVAHGFRRRKSVSEGDDHVNGSAVAQIPSIFSSSPPPTLPAGYLGGTSTPVYAQSTHSVVPPPSIAESTSGHVRGEPGSVTFTIISAKGYTGTNVRVHVKQQIGKGMKEVHKTKQLKMAAEHPIHWNEHPESFKANCGSDTPFAIQVKDVHTFGPDEDLGSVEVRIGQGEQNIQCGKGSVVIRTDFKALPQTLDGVDSTSVDGHGPVTPRNRLRKSFHVGLGSKRPARETGTERIERS